MKKQIDMQELLDKLKERYKYAVQYDANDQWTLGFERAEAVVIDYFLECFGYNPKELETNARQLIERLVKQNQP